jgi:sporulation protein YlmC with PRC-barrel domain
MVIFLVKADRLSGKKVIGANGNVIGEVSGVELDLTEWRVTSLYVDLSDNAAKELGISTSFWSATSICLPVTIVNQIGDVITITKNTSELIGYTECPQRSTVTPITTPPV